MREEDIIGGTVTMTDRQQETEMTEPSSGALTTTTSVPALPDHESVPLTATASSTRGLESQADVTEAPKTQLKDGAQAAENQAAPKPSGKLNTIQKMFLYFRRAVVLSHRGRNWTLLQNASRCLWDCAHSLLSRAVRQSERLSPKLHKPSHTHEMSHSLTVERLRSDGWMAFYCAADCLLDMLVQLEDGSYILRRQAMEQKTAQEQSKRQVPDKRVEKTRIHETTESGTEQKDGTEQEQPAMGFSTRAKSASAMSSPLPRDVKSGSVESQGTRMHDRDSSQSQTSQFTSTLEESTTLARSATLPFTIHSSISEDAADALSQDRALNPEGEESTETSTEMDGTLDVRTTSAAARRATLSQPMLVGENGWFGGLVDEAGGASLTFEARLDDRSVVDLRWVKRVVMQSMRLLFYEGQWEKLADIALRFNSLTK